eukprot:m.61556 g.61556  ORF g.61556 m.61556 type:complete len:145 (-) comp15762_c0_seq9:199-633(-)
MTSDSTRCSDLQSHRGQFYIVHRVSCGVVSTVSDIDAARMLCKSPDLLRAEALRRCATWHAPIPQLLASTEDFAMSGYPVFDRDPLDADDLRTGGGSTRSTSPVTLIGDAVSSLAPGLLCPDGKSWNYQLCSQTVSMCKWLQAQ